MALFPSMPLHGHRDVDVDHVVESHEMPALEEDADSAEKLSEGPNKAEARFKLEQARRLQAAIDAMRERRC